MLGATLGPGRTPRRVLWASSNVILSFFHLSAAFPEVLQPQPFKARQSRYNSHASSFSLCDFHERCCVCVSVRVCACALESHSSRNQEASQE